MGTARRSRAVRWAALLALVALVALASQHFGLLSRPKPWNVVLVTFDTTRADRLESYGNSRIKTPTLNRLAAEGYRFSNAMSVAPITAPSHSSILTGLYPMAHGFRDNGLFVLGDEQITLPEILKEHGYATAAAIGAFPLIGKFGFGQGFDLFDDHLSGQFEDHLGQRVLPKTRMFFDERRAAQVNEAVMPWLTEHAADPFFVWVHYFDPHQPFEPPPPYDQLYADDLYSGEIAYTDGRLGRLLEHIESLGVLDRTLVVMTADHGEGLGEHNEATHAVLAYNSTLHVPLIIRTPATMGQPGKVIEERVGLVDLVPTILDLLDIELPEHLQGRSLTGLMQDEQQIAPQYYAENISTRLTHGWGELRVLYDGSFKYIHGPRPELYDLQSDPDELNNLASAEAAETARLHDQLGVFLLDHTVGVSTTNPIDEDVVRRLQALGYLQGGADAGGGEPITEVLRDGGIPPHERVSDINNMSAAKHLLFQERYADALVYTTKLVTGSPDSPAYNELHASALAATGRLDEAWAVLERQMELSTPSDSLVVSLAFRKFQSGQRDVAVALLDRYSTLAKSHQAYWLLSGFHEQLGNAEQHSAALRSALEIQPDFVPARVDLAIHLAQSGANQEAEQQFKMAMEAAPYFPKAAYNYGTFLLSEDRLAEAIGYFRRTVELAPTYPKGHLALVAALIDSGELEAAGRAAQPLRELAPRSAERQQAEALLLEAQRQAAESSL